MYQQLASLSFPIQLLCERCRITLLAERDVTELHEDRDYMLGILTTIVRVKCPSEFCGATIIAQHRQQLPARVDDRKAMRAHVTEALASGKGPLESLGFAKIMVRLKQRGR